MHDAILARGEVTRLMRTNHLHVMLPREPIADFCRRHHIRKLAVFGSALGEDFGPESDLDLLVERLTQRRAPPAVPLRPREGWLGIPHKYSTLGHALAGACCYNRDARMKGT